MVPTKDDLRTLLALAAFVGFLSGVGLSLRTFSDYDPLTEAWREADLQREIDRHPYFQTPRS